MKKTENAAVRPKMLCLAVVCGLLLVDGGTNEFPVSPGAGAFPGETGGFGWSLQQGVLEEVVPLLGYGSLPEQKTQIAEDETTYRTLTTEELISRGTSASAVPGRTDTDSAGSGARRADNRGSRRGDQSRQPDRCRSTERSCPIMRLWCRISMPLMPILWRGGVELSAEKSPGDEDMTLAKEGEKPQILIYHFARSQEAFAGLCTGRCEYRYCRSGRASDTVPEGTIWLRGTASYRRVRCGDHADGMRIPKPFRQWNRSLQRIRPYR